MTEATSCGGVVIFRGKILLLYKSYRNRYDGWVLPKGTVEEGETHEETALREVKEESDIDGTIIKYVGKSEYTFYSFHEQIVKSVHWYLMESDSYHSKPQKEEFFVDSGYYKFHEAYHLLKFPNEKEILKKAYDEYKQLKSKDRWGNHSRKEYGKKDKEESC
ncbi:MAG: NUDIX hydrolase [Anaerostipes sp.]|nr:NUDIX hydrolase [Anaerostipes sp.]